MPKECSSRKLKLKKIKYILNALVSIVFLFNRFGQLNKFGNKTVERIRPQNDLSTNVCQMSK